MYTSIMVKFFTQICPMSAVRSRSSVMVSHQCLAISKGKLMPLQSNKLINQCRAFAEETGGKGPGGPAEPSKPGKEEQIETIKIPGFVHPDTKNEEGYFTQKAHQQLEELKKKIEKPTIENREKTE